MVNSPVMANIDDTKHLLVSDSNEISQQWDSKRLSISELSRLAQDVVFTDHMSEIVERYLPHNLLSQQRSLLQGRMDNQRAALNGLSENPTKFKAVEGQIILIDADSSALSSRTPLQIVQDNWMIPMGYQVQQIKGCMLRGTTGTSHDIVNLPGNTSVELGPENMPSHQHNSGITLDSQRICMRQQSEQIDQTQSIPASGFRCDMFCNDSQGSGLDRNELDGADGNELFEVQEAGHARTPHGNMPAYRRYYAFVVKKIG